MNSLGQRLKEIRGSLSLYEVGQGSGVNNSNIAKYEQGTVLPTRASLRKLADYFEVPYQELFELYLSDTYTEAEERRYIKAWANKQTS